MKEVKIKTKDCKESDSWFLRFYGREDSEIRQCLGEIAAVHGMPDFIYTIKDADKSVNIFVPYDCLPARQVDLYFADNSGVQFFRSKNKLVMATYLKWSSECGKYGKPELVVRKPHDAAFGI